jgi:hypothetical protein
MSSRLLIPRVGATGVLLAVLVGVAGGCGGVKRVPASGTVTLDGEPLKEGMLEFVPDASKGNNLRVSCMSPISNGRFNLNTTGMDRADNGAGAPVGWFKVRYFNPNERGYDPNTKQKDTAPKVADKYLSEETTTIVIELTDPPPPEGYKIELTSK